MRKRFTKDGHRFAVTEISCGVYERVDVDGFSSEYAVSPQKRTAMIKKFKYEVLDARETL